MSILDKVFGKKADADPGEEDVQLLAEEIVSPVEGNVIPLGQIEDEAFAAGALGPGAAIEPTVGKIYAPADGEITTFFPTCHAIAIRTTGGAEILIHVGIDTVRLDGDGFSPKRKQNETVKKGDLLLEFDIEKIKASGLSPMTPVVVTNGEEYREVSVITEPTIRAGEVLICLGP